MNRDLVSRDARRAREWAQEKRRGRRVKLPKPSTAVIGGVCGWAVVDAIPGWVWESAAATAGTAVVGAGTYLAYRWRDVSPVTGGLVPTEEEQQLLSRLAPEYWAAHREQRGLKNTITGVAELTESGITCAVRLDHTWTPPKFADAEQHVRALLGARTSLRMEITPGDRGGWSLLTLRTRTAVDGADTMWHPGRVGIGIDTITGRPVEIPLDARLTVAGASGSGKSWSSRPHMAAAHMAGHLVFVDGKGEEATVWENVCRVAMEPDDIRAAVAEVHAEMNRRKDVMRERGISVWDGEQLTLFVDEGRVILAYKDKELTQQLIDVSALGRSRGVVLKWATQYPVTSGDSPGIHAQIAANTDARFALRVKNLTHAQVALDDDADYRPDLIPATKESRGHGYLGGYGRRLVRTWTMTDDMVRALPRRVWSPDGVEEPLSGRPVLSLVKDEPVSAGRELSGHDGAILRFVQAAEGPVRQKVIGEELGIAKGSVSKAVKRLVDAGHLVRAEDGALFVTNATTAEEVSA